ncbi:uncharacterized protein LOC143587395 [Bidens hawaiensis]|uniref:uncharacterized protein LOC143587395 n=1 Tax=Bidens hawaiensis TaxID=980011 RepID=UPI00404B2DB7
MDDTHKLSLKDKIKHFFCLACCFTTSRREALRSDSSSPPSATKRPPFLIGASSQWIKSRASVDLPEIRHKCRSLFTRIGNGNGGPINHRRRRSSADFSYDPLSYALNFEEDAGEEDDPVMGFASRLPPTPPPAAV